MLAGWRASRDGCARPASSRVAPWCHRGNGPRSRETTTLKRIFARSGMECKRPSLPRHAQEKKHARAPASEDAGTRVQAFWKGPVHPFGSLATTTADPLKSTALAHSFASQPHDWFAFVEDELRSSLKGRIDRGKPLVKTPRRRFCARYQRRIALPQVRPAPKPLTRSKSPRWISAARFASSRTSGIEPADVLP